MNLRHFPYLFTILLLGCGEPASSTFENDEVLSSSMQLDPPEDSVESSDDDSSDDDSSDDDSSDDKDGRGVKDNGKDEQALPLPTSAPKIGIHD